MSLNPLIWPRLLPDVFVTDPAEMFLGIGSILDGRHAAATVKLVAGAGYGGYERLPSLDARWVIHWVRGPLTCRLLGLSESLGLGDPAMLLPHACFACSGRGDTVAANAIRRTVGPHAALRKSRPGCMARGRRRSRGAAD